MILLPSRRLPVLFRREGKAHPRWRGIRPKKVYEMHVEYKQYKYDRFRSNLNNLRASVKKHQARADSDSADLEHDMRLHPPVTVNPRGCQRWEGSDAERLLKEDRVKVRAGLVEARKPRELHQSRPEFQAFPLTVFRDHIYQEDRDVRARSYWLNKSNFK